MKLRLYLDHQVHVAVATGLRARGVDVLRAAEDGAADWSDADVLERATQLGRIVFTQDRDFLVLARDRQAAAVPFSGIVFANQMDVTIGSLIRDLEAICCVLSESDMQDSLVYLPL
jgi:hypothetical protein